MSLENFSEIWAHAPYSGDKLLVLLALADAPDYTGASLVHEAYIAKRARISMERLIEILKELEAEGAIHVWSSVGAWGGGCLGVKLLFPWSTDDQPITQEIKKTSEPVGYVYLLKCGDYFKIGHTKNLSRRINQLSIQLPHAAEVIAAFAVHNPPEVERFWHEEFATLRLNGEWFTLTAEEVEDFKARMLLGTSITG